MAYEELMAKQEKQLEQGKILLAKGKELLAEGRKLC